MNNDILVMIELLSIDERLVFKSERKKSIDCWKGIIQCRDSTCGIRRACHFSQNG